MALSEIFRIIWLDAYIGQDNECHSFKRKFCNTLQPGARYGDPLDILICAVMENAAPFTFVDTIPKAIEAIQLYRGKQVIFITSGSLGQRIISQISSTYHHVFSFYIFCAVTQNYYELACEYRECLQIFNNEIDLLVRLVRDISKEIIDRGKRHLIENDPRPALEHFEHAEALENVANETDKLNRPFTDRLRLLNGSGDDIGLIRRSKNMIEEQEQESMDDTAPEPFIAETNAEQYNEFEQEDPDLLPFEAETQHENQGSPIAQQIYQDEDL